MIDLTGKRFGRLVVQHAEKRGRGYTLTMRCDCGRIVKMPLSHVQGSVRSCGCRQSDYRKYLETARSIDITGHRFGLLTAIRRAARENQGSYWECLCDCGTTKVVRATALRSGHTTSCGCARISAGRKNGGSTSADRQIDMAGRKYGMLLVLGKGTSRQNRKSMWHCLCDCGRAALVRGDQLRRGTTLSCGCLKVTAGAETTIRLLGSKPVTT